MKVRVLVGLSGASGVQLGVKLANFAQNAGCEVGVIYTQNALKSWWFERQNAEFNEEVAKTQLQNSLLDKIQIFNQIHHAPASASSLWEALCVVPCSTNTLAKISCGIADNLLTRTAAVMLKERRKMVLAVREMPLSTLVLQQLSALSQMGAVIAPPIFASYANPQNLEELQEFFVGKFLDVLGVGNSLFTRWDKRN